VSESDSAASGRAAPLQLVRLPVDKPLPAVAFLKSRSGGVMDLTRTLGTSRADPPAATPGPAPCGGHADNI